jgi:transposase InsO family protein
LSTLVDVKGAKEWRTLRALVDSGTTENLISHLIAKELGGEWEPTFRTAKGVGDQEIQLFGQAQLTLRIKDDEGVTRQGEHSFSATELEEYDLMLGYPWLHRENPKINWREGSWRFPVEDIQYLSHEEAEGLRSRGEPVYVAMLYRMEGEGQEPMVLGVPEEYHAFLDVFDDEGAASLPEYSKRAEHAIDIEPGKQPPWGPIYSLSAKELETLRAYIEDALQKGWIRHSTSPAGAPILFVPKPDGSKRLCVDYRGLNAMTVRNRHPIPLISEILDRLSGAVIFTKLDAKDAYQRMRIRKGDEWKTAFRTRYGLFEYLVMPFGLCNAPASFQAYINEALAGLVDVLCIVYLDDVLIYSKRSEDHPQHVRTVLERLRKFKIYCNLKKCKFSTTEVEFLGFIVSTKGVSMDTSRVETITEWPEPTSFKDLQVFLGFANFYRRFIEGYSRIAQPLTGMLKGSDKGKKAGPFLWNEEEAEAFRTLKTAFTSAPLLRHFDPNQPIRLETDGSGMAIAAILTQPYTDEAGVTRWHPIAFYSRKLKDAEIRYDVHDIELLAIVAAFKHWRHYMQDSNFPVTVRTDHNNLIYFMKKVTINNRQAHWIEFLAGFDFQIEHRPGRTNPADGPSRRPDYVDRQHQAYNGLLPTLQQKLTRGLSEVATSNKSEASQQSTRIRAVFAKANSRTETKDILHVVDQLMRPLHGEGAEQTQAFMPRCRAVRGAAAETPYEDPSLDLQKLISQAQNGDPFLRGRVQRMTKRLPRTDGVEREWVIHRESGVLYRNGKMPLPRVPALIEELLRIHHDDPLAGHFGVAKTTELLRRKYEWPGMRKDVKEYVKTCQICQKMVTKRHRPYGELQPLPQPSGPGEEITMDFITGLPPSLHPLTKKAYDSILVVVDRYTKYALYIATNKTITASDLAILILRYVITEFGIPKGIVSDRGSVFTSNYWSCLCFYLKIRQRLSTAFHPQTDGQTERQNQTIEQYLRCFVTSLQDEWVGLLPLAQFTYNNSYHTTIQMSPFRALKGFDPQMPDLSVADAPRKGDAPEAIERVAQLQEEREALARHWVKATQAQSKHYNAKRKPMEFSMGDQVLLSAKNLKLRRPNRKLAERFVGPFKIVEIIGKQAYRLELPQELAVHPTFHVSLLEPYYERQPVSGGATDAPRVGIQTES